MQQMTPDRRFAILTYMDARLDPAKFAGLGEGNAHVIRNAGGRASDDAFRSLVISYKLPGTRERFVIHHTDCSMGDAGVKLPDGPGSEFWFSVRLRRDRSTALAGETLAR